MPSSPARDYLARQYGIAWQLTALHLETLTTEECLWRPAATGLHVWQGADGAWTADWPEHEGYDLGPSSIAWLTWHLLYWWSMAHDHCFGGGTLSRDDVKWPGTAERVRQQVRQLKTAWDAALAQTSDAELASSQRTRWPFRDRPLGDLFAWVNIELTKSAAEIGYARFLHAARS